MLRRVALVLLGLVLSCGALSVDDVFPGGAGGTSTAQVKCRNGYSIGGGVDDATKKAAYTLFAPCRLFCECVGSDGSCKHCCKYDTGTCYRHAPVYGFTSSSECFKCKQNSNATSLVLHATAIMGRVFTSSVDTSKQWISRGTDYSIPLVANAAGMEFVYYQDDIACWGLREDNSPAGVAGETIPCPSIDSDYPVTKESTDLAPVHSGTDYTPPNDELSSVLNQGGCGNCYIQSAMSVLTDRILKQADAAARSSMKNLAETYSTGHTTRCHFSSNGGDTGDACDGGFPDVVLLQTTGVAVSKYGRSVLALHEGLTKCTGGVYGGPSVTTTHPNTTKEYYSEYAYGCVKGCKPFQAGFSGPPVPSGATCPPGYTDNADTLHSGLLPNAAAVTEASGSNVNQFINACGCQGQVVSTGNCQTCCARNTGGTIYTMKDATPNQCNYNDLVSAGYSLGSASSWTHFGMTGQSIMAWSGVPEAERFNTLSTCGCPAPSVSYTAGSTCSKCCVDHRSDKGPGWQYTAQTKAAQPPAQCTGTGVTAGSTPGAAECSIGACGSTCDDASSWPSPKVVMDDSPGSVYNSIGVAWKQPSGWNPMNEFFIKDEIAQYGPVEASFQVPDNFGSFFNSQPQGVFVSSADQATHGGHSVSIVGWGEDSSQKYWLVRNSWARDWAYGGFFKIEIGGHSAGPKVGFTTANYSGTVAIAPFFKSGGASSSSPIDNNVDVVTHGSQEQSGKNGTVGKGQPIPCTDDHSSAVNQLRAWFLANASNYNGVKATCQVPWTYVSQTDCSAKIIQGLHVHTILHVKDCDDISYNWIVRWGWHKQTGDINDAYVILNDGPHPVTNTAFGSSTNSIDAAFLTTTPASDTTSNIETASGVTIRVRSLLALMAPFAHILYLLL